MTEEVWKTPEEMMAAAKEWQLQGRDPKSEQDWRSVVSFWAVNVAPEVTDSAVRLLCRLFNCPLSMDTVTQIVTQQLDARAARNN